MLHCACSLFQPVSVDSMKTLKLINLMKNKSDKLFVLMQFFLSFCKYQQCFGRQEQLGLLGVECRSSILSIPLTLKKHAIFSFEINVIFSVSTFRYAKNVQRKKIILKLHQWKLLCQQNLYSYSFLG